LFLNHGSILANREKGDHLDLMKLVVGHNKRQAILNQEATAIFVGPQVLMLNSPHPKCMQNPVSFKAFSRDAVQIWSQTSLRLETYPQKIMLERQSSDACFKDDVCIESLLDGRLLFGSSVVTTTTSIAPHVL
jgi:hypothetical protein